MFYHTDPIRRLIHSGKITMAGNKKYKIYGKLSCKSGKRMKPEHRVFFANEAEAIAAGYRPCGHCMREKYKLWKKKYLANCTTGDSSL